MKPYYFVAVLQAGLQYTMGIKMKIILIILGLFIVWFIQRLVYEKNWKKGLNAEVSFEHSAVTEGSETILFEMVSNRKWMILPTLKVMFKTDKGLHFEKQENMKITDYCYKCDIFSLFPYQKIVRRHEVTCAKRGLYDVDELDLTAGDIWFSGEYYSTCENKARLYVFPAKADLERTDVPYERIMGNIQTRKYLQEDPFAFAGIREYQSYDSMRSINWKISAKNSTYMVNVHDATASQAICFLFNADQDTIWHHDDLLEEGIRIVSTLARQFLEQGVPVQFLTNGKDKITKESLYLRAGSGEAHGEMLDEQLARMDLTLEAERFHGRMEELCNGKSENVLYVFVSTSCREELQEDFLRLREQSRGSVWIAPVYRGTLLDMHPGIAGDMICWEVERGG